MARRRVNKKIMAKLLEAEVLEDKQVKGQWRVEWIGEEGECYVTIFSGPHAEYRAKDYQKYAQTRITEEGPY